jgi:hypothetical protein
VDNIGRDEMIVFRFPSDAYSPESFRIGYASGDSDVVTYIGGTLGGPDDILSLFLAGTFNWDTFVANPGGLGFTPQTFLDVPVGVDQPFTTGASGRYLIIGARNETDSCSGQPCEGGDDTFKIQQIVGTPPAVVPGPGTLLLLAVGLGGLAGLGRHRP